MTSAISEDLRARRSEIVKQHIDAENRHDPDGVVASFDQPCYDIPSFGHAGQVNGPEAVRESGKGWSPGSPICISSQGGSCTAMTPSSSR
jgi:hypothetical protein